MLLRQDDESIMAISQPAHAWVSGQLASAWGNDQFEAPCEEVCLAAQLHDIGFGPWELHPTLNPATGLPHTFMEMPSAVQLPLWTSGIHQLVRFSRYSALLVSMHFTVLAQRILRDRSSEEAALAADFLEAQNQLQATLLTSLRNDFYYGSRSADEEVRRDQQFLSLVDWISLQLLLRFKDERVTREQEARPTAAQFELRPLNIPGTEVSLDPWPFRKTSLRLVCDGRRLFTRFSDEEKMREGIRAASQVTLTIDLVPSSSSQAAPT